jgi:hypothetical protein
VPLSAVDVISPAFERMKRQLFRPFRWGQWLRFALVGFLAGEMGQNAGSGLRLPLNFVSSFPKSNEFQVLWPGRGPLFLFGVLLALLLSAVLVVVLIYIGSRMRFVLFDSIVKGECRIRESWGRYAGPAFRLFVFQILFSLMAIVSMAALIGIPLLAAVTIGVFENPSRHILALVLGGIVLLFLFLLLLITLLLVHVLTKDFVVPQMALEDVSISVGWSRLWTFLKAEKGGYTGYLGMKILLDIAASIVLGIVGFIVILIILIPFGGIGLFGVLAGRAAGLDWNPVTISIAIVFGIIAVLALFFLASLVSVPMIVFFPAYSVYFFAERYRPLHERLYPPPAEPDLSTLSPQP